MGYFSNKFKPTKNIIRGKIANEMGQAFENILRSVCQRSKATCTRIPDGCRMVYTKSGAAIPRRVPTPFDFLITKDNRAACVDCKTIESGNFGFSMLTPHQVSSLMSILDSKIPAGYLIWYRDIDKVIFYCADVLNRLNKRESLKIEDGVLCGSHEDFSLKPILEYFEGKQ